MIAELLFGVTPVHADWVRCAEDFIGWQSYDGALWAYYQSRYWTMASLGVNPEYGQLYAINLDGRTLEVYTAFEYTDPAGTTATGYWMLDSETGAGTYAWGIFWGYLHQVGLNEYCMG